MKGKVNLSKSTMLIISFVVFFFSASVAIAEDCKRTIEGNDQMQFNLSSIEVPSSCKSIDLTLKHTGKLPVNAMGHNWVLVKKSDVNDVGVAGMGAGLANNHVPPNDARVLAYTKMIGGGEEVTIKVDISKLDPATEYSYICTFPGHYSIMKGDFKITS